MNTSRLVFQFLAEPNDVNFGGKVHGGAVMKWIDQTGFACASAWATSYCVTVYVGGIRFMKPILIGDLVKVEAKIIYTGNSSMHIAVDVSSKRVDGKDFAKTTHCIIVFVAVDENGKTISVPKWHPITEKELEQEKHAVKLMDLRKTIENEMFPFK